jgi:hypothetical protein
MPAQISCPSGGIRVAVTGQSPGGQGTICVQGSTVETQPHPQGRAAAANGPILRIRVVDLVTSASPLPSPVYQPGDVDIPVTGQRWCATAVPVPTCTSIGTPLTAVVWTLAGSSLPTQPDDMQSFLGVSGGMSGMTDCCFGCGSGGHESVRGYAAAADRLPADAAVRLTVPDGPAAGHHAAGPVARLLWRGRVGAAVCEVQVCPARGLLVRVDGRPVEAAGVAFEPLSALLPGGPFGAAGDVVVSQA